MARFQYAEDIDGQIGTKVEAMRAAQRPPPPCRGPERRHASRRGEAGAPYATGEEATPPVRAAIRAAPTTRRRRGVDGTSFLDS
ncbi:hypothetical protein CJD44_27520 [Streptomyces sp. alain-838]|nr:hypothetical protein CJD44_27520 [Streptomyces sp. alain-838]